MPTLTDNELLRRYLRGDINAAQEAELERRAATDPLLAEAMEGIRAFPAHDHAAGIQAMLVKARPAEAKPVMQASRRRLPKYWWAAAAGFLLVLAAMFLLPLGLVEDAREVAMAEEPVASEAAPASPPATQREPFETDEESDAEVERSENIASPPPPPAPAAAPVSPQIATAKQEAIPLEPVVTEEETTEFLDEMVVETTPASSGSATTPIVTNSGADAGARVRARKQQAVEQTSAPASNQTNELRNETSAFTKRQPTYLTGSITDQDGTPVANALVRQPGLPLGERTDSNGVFRMNFDATTTLLNIEAEGYEDEQVELVPNGEDLQITLEAIPSRAPDYFQTGAVENIDVESITGGRYGRKPPGYARPDEGFKTLRERIESSRPEALPAGRVKVSFLVDPDGQLSEFKFKGRTEQATRDYVRRALLATPGWEVRRGDEPVRVHLGFNFR